MTSSPTDLTEGHKKVIDVIIGAGEGSNLIIDDEYMSTRHCRVICYDDMTAFIEDLGTTNGTWVNGVRIIAPHQLHNGDKVRIGHTDIPIPTVDELLDRATVKL